MATQSMGAGRLNQRYRFEKRVEVADGAGNFEGEWQLQFTCSGNRKYLRVRGGSETVLAARLTATPLVILTIRSSLQARSVVATWRAVDDRTGEVFNIRENPQETDNRLYLEMLAEAGIAT